MSKVAVHLQPVSKQLLGTWVSDGLSISAYYVGSEYQRQLAQSIVNSRKPNIAWDQWCDAVAERIPYTIWWESVDRVDDETAQEAFIRLTS